MIENIPNWINIVFFILALFSIYMYYLSNSKPIKIVLIILFWSISHSILAYKGFYLNTTSFPPRFLLVLIPFIISIIYGILPNKINFILKNRNTKISTFLHVLRFPVEIILFKLFTYDMIPVLMTFEGVNFDILIGISAPIVGYLHLKNKLSNKILISWNVIGLMFILIILVTGILTSELPFQQFGFDQPNRAINYFPFILLPATIVPIVIYTHITDIMFLINKSKNKF